MLPLSGPDPYIFITKHSLPLSAKIRSGWWAVRGRIGTRGKGSSASLHVTHLNKTNICIFHNFRFCSGTLSLAVVRVTYFFCSAFILADSFLFPICSSFLPHGFGCQCCPFTRIGDPQKDTEKNLKFHKIFVGERERHILLNKTRKCKRKTTKTH